MELLTVLNTRGPEVHQGKEGMGTYICAKKKREELSNVLSAMRKAAAKKG